MLHNHIIPNLNKIIKGDVKFSDNEGRALAQIILNEFNNQKQNTSCNHDVIYEHFNSACEEIEDLQQEILHTQKEILYLMGEIAETRSKETGNHVKRVAYYSYILAKEFGLNEEEAKLLKNASPMHDIGKVAIPDSILNKPSRLTKDEFEIMKEHTQIGYHLLKNSHRPLLQTASIVAHQHHEKWNGKGYPQGLKGEEIHIYGRITAIADVFDALSSSRPYKHGWELVDILNLFEKEKGEHFDPQLIDIFFQNLHKFLKIQNQFKDMNIN